MSATTRLALPFIVPGQAQKELFHNEALQLLDVLVAAVVEGPPSEDPPAAPLVGSCYIVGGSPGGEWSGHAHQLAAYSAGGWRFIAPCEGMSAHVRASGILACFRNGLWELGTMRALKVEIDGQQVVGRRGASIADPVGGRSTDGEARAAIGQILAALREHGLIEV